MSTYIFFTDLFKSFLTYKLNSAEILKKNTRNEFKISIPTFIENRLSLNLLSTFYGNI